MKRITIDAKDIQQITGRSSRYAQGVLTRIRKKTGKKRLHPITIYELSDHLKIPLEEIIAQLKL